MPDDSSTDGPDGVWRALFGKHILSAMRYKTAVGPDRISAELFCEALKHTGCVMPNGLRESIKGLVEASRALQEQQERGGSVTREAVLAAYTGIIRVVHASGVKTNAEGGAEPAAQWGQEL